MLTANNQTKVYGAALPSLTFTTTGLVNGDTAAGVLSGNLTTTAMAASGAGTYPITQGNLAQAGANYTLSFTSASVKEYGKYHAGQVGAGRVAVTICFAVTFAWFGVSSFWRVRKKKQRS